jgi:hypothetical protein
MYLIKFGVDCQPRLSLSSGYLLKPCWSVVLSTNLRECIPISRRLAQTSCPQGISGLSFDFEKALLLSFFLDTSPLRL